MNSYILMKTQKNKVLEILKSIGLKPIEFFWEEKLLNRIPSVVDEGLVSRLIHKPTSYYFEFDIREEGKYYFEFSPGQHSPIEKKNCLGWPEAPIFVNDWAKYLRRELEAPDLWAILMDNLKIIELAEDEKSQEQFTKDQKEDIKQSLTEIKNFISTNFTETDLKLKLLEDKITYISNAVDRMSRQDWIHTAIGVFFTISVGLCLAPEQAKSIFDYVSIIFSNLKVKLIAKMV